MYKDKKRYKDKKDSQGQRQRERQRQRQIIGIKERSHVFLTIRDNHLSPGLSLSTSPNLTSLPVYGNTSEMLQPAVVAAAAAAELRKLK